MESYQRRRMSDNNLAANNYYRYKGSPVRKSQSEADYMEQYPEVPCSICPLSLLFTHVPV